MSDLDRLEKSVEQLAALVKAREAERAQFIAALQFYADLRNYASRHYDDGGGRFDEIPSHVSDDEGHLARKALLGLPS